MSDIDLRRSRKNMKFQCQIWISYVLFISLMVYDIFALLNATEPLISKDDIDLGNNNFSMNETTNQTADEPYVRLMVKKMMDSHPDNITVDLMAKDRYLDWLAVIQESKEVGIEVTLEVLAISVLLLVNLLALVGLKRGQAFFLVPWMIVYFTGLFASYFRTLVILLEQVFRKDANTSISSIYYPLATATIFTLAWVFVFNIFKRIKSNLDEDRRGSTRV